LERLLEALKRDVHACSERRLEDGIMNLGEVEREIMKLCRSPFVEKKDPIPPDWVPITDVLAILCRFRKHWKIFRAAKDEEETRLISEVFGEEYRHSQS
jgi:hypothetical protein